MGPGAAREWEAMREISAKIKQLDFKPTVLVEQVSGILSDAILEGALKGGDQLIEAELKEEFGISRSPLREAFRVLEKKGLVEIVPRRGTFVKRITRKDIEEHFPIRAALEGLAARMAYGHMTAEHLEEMTESFKKMNRAVRNHDAKAFWEHHLVFHEIFINASGNDLLIGLLQTLRMHSLWYRFSYQYYKEDFRKSLAVHQKILDLFREKNADAGKIEFTVRSHIEIAVERFIDYLREQEDLDATKKRDA
jgi:DNA-binding GntR family transcriptional regulator